MQIEETAGTPNKFIVMRQEVLEDKNLTVVEKMVYARICTFDTYFESSEACGQVLGLSHRQVERAKRKLEKAGYIKCVTNTGRGKQYKPKYDLPKLADQTYHEWQVRPTKIGNSDLPKLADIDKRLEENIEESNSTNKVKKERKKKTSKPIESSYDKVIDEMVEDQELRDLLVEHLRLRALNRWPKLTDDGFRRNIKALLNYTNNDITLAKKQVETAVMHGWRGFLWQSENKKASADDAMYQKQPGEDLTWSNILDVWKKALGHRPLETKENVEAIKKLLAEYGEDNTLRMIGALAMRAQASRYLTKEIKGVSSPVGLLQNHEYVWNYYQVNAQTWARRADNDGRKPWQI